MRPHLCALAASLLFFAPGCETKPPASDNERISTGGPAATQPDRMTGCERPASISAKYNVSAEIENKVIEFLNARGAVSASSDVRRIATELMLDEEVATYLRCLMQKQQGLTPGQVAWYSIKADLVRVRPDALPTWLAGSPFPGAGGPVHLKIPVNRDAYTGPADATKLAQDWEVHTDDWTGIAIGYTLRVEDAGRNLVADLWWEVTELEDDGKYDNKTRIRSARNSVLLATLPADLQGYRFAAPAEASAARAENIRGKQHNYVSLRPIGWMRDIRVRFDSEESNDRPAQSLQAVFRFDAAIEPVP